MDEITTKLSVTTHSGDVDEVEVVNYNSLELAENLNDNSIQAIALGNNVYARIDIKGVKPIVPENTDDE